MRSGRWFTRLLTLTAVSCFLAVLYFGFHSTAPSGASGGSISDNNHKEWDVTKGRRCGNSSPSSSKSSASGSSPSSLLPMIYVITPTFSRPTQIADLTRLSHTLLLVPRLHWILVEDASSRTPAVTSFLSHLDAYFLTGSRQCNSYDLKWTHLNVATPAGFKVRPKDPSWLKPKGVLQRNAGLHWLRSQSKQHQNSRQREEFEAAVVYFGDDDNTYDVRVFEEMRDTKKVSVWPVGLAGNLKVEKPNVQNDRVIGFNSVWKPERPYPIDMAGFAVNLSLLLQTESASFTYDVPRGYQESHILSQLISSMHELEPKADSCSRVYVWHTRTEKAKLTGEKKLNAPSNQGIEL